MEFFLSLLMTTICVSLWWYLTKSFAIQYTKLRVFGLEVDRAIVMNKFKQQKNKDKTVIR